MLWALHHYLLPISLHLKALEIFVAWYTMDNVSVGYQLCRPFNLCTPRPGNPSTKMPELTTYRSGLYIEWLNSPRASTDTWPHTNGISTFSSRPWCFLCLSYSTFFIRRIMYQTFLGGKRKISIWRWVEATHRIHKPYGNLGVMVDWGSGSSI